ncbi:MAG: 4Fe-4S dicluster domain-containing protein [Desulfovibrionaceae bacterium]|nr:4Fe-4S dicluster domain-containing protein [Desulfovibrionaceae bacterium]
MRINSVELVSFSPTGGTRRIVEWIGEALRASLPDEPRIVAHDLLRQPPRQDCALPQGSLLVAGMPVYGGRIPPHCLPLLRRFKSRNAPALAVAVYGNRDYEDALLELRNALGGSGFVVTGAAAFISRHSVFPQVAADRPDAADQRVAEDFARRSAERLMSLDGLSRELKIAVKGNAPYKELKPGGPRPDVDHAKCARCGACVTICPVKALTMSGEADASVARDPDLCMGCAACIQVCPAGAQGWRGPQYDAMSAMFAEKFAARREPEIFV